METIMPALGFLGLIFMIIMFWLSGYHLDGRCWGKWVEDGISMSPRGFKHKCNKCGKIEIERL